MIYPQKRYNRRHKIVIAFGILLAVLLQAFPYFSLTREDVKEHEKCIELVENPDCAQEQNLKPYAVYDDHLSRIDAKSCKDYYDQTITGSAMPMWFGLITLVVLLCDAVGSIVFVVWLIWFIIHSIYKWTEK